MARAQSGAWVIEEQGFGADGVVCYRTRAGRYDSVAAAAGAGRRQTPTGNRWVVRHRTGGPVVAGGAGRKEPIGRRIETRKETPVLNAHELVEALAALVADAAEDRVPRRGDDGLYRARVESFADAGVLTRDEGLVVRLHNGSEYQVTVVRSERAHEPVAQCVECGDDFADPDGFAAHLLAHGWDPDDAAVEWDREMDRQDA